MDIQKNQSHVKEKAWTWLPHVLLMIWIIYLGISIWQHVLHSVQPPLYDPLSYLQKAKNFWLAVEQGMWTNPFNIQPTVRPPGTILMSYPFGFSSDFRGFHFRSVFFPILSVVASVYIVSGVSRSKETGWWVASIVFLTSSLPMFYHFDLNEDVYFPTYWGMVDNFQAGIAALATAAVMRSLMTNSRPWLWGGAFLASFSLLIKPSGLMVMALIAILWVTVATIEWRWSSTLKVSYSSFRAFLFHNGIIFLIFYFVVIVLSFSSKYLSKSNIAFGKQALMVMSEVLQISFHQGVSLLRQSAGEAVVLWIIVVGASFLHFFLKNRHAREIQTIKICGLLVVSLVIWSIGAWYWLVIQAGGNQIRYFYPFMLMGLICMIPAALHVWPQCNRLVRFFLFAFCILPALNIGGLLAAGNSPSIPWQESSGVSVSVGNDRETVRQAYDFLAELKKTNKSVQLYSFNNGVLPAIFENVGTLERILYPDLPAFYSVLPVDWLRGFAVRIEELIDSDYILIRKYSDPKINNLLLAKQIDSFSDETTLFEAWLFTLDESSGVEIASDGQVLRLLRIIDRTALASVIEQFVSERDWRPEFTSANKPVFWWNSDALWKYTEKPAIEEVRFEGIYNLHALAMSRNDNGLRIEVWWEELKSEEANKSRNLFLHLVDSEGEIIENSQIALFPYKPPFENRRWRHGEATFRLKSLNKGATSLAFGIYEPSGNFLLADKGVTDWDGKRVLLPIDSITNAQPIDANPLNIK